MDDQYTSQVRQKMLKCLEVTKVDLATVRTGRATPALVDHIEINAYGGSQRLKVRELATITTSDAQTILIHPFDPSTKEEIVKGILEANVGLTPIVE
ncbi:MAG: ribosome recycling factor, partial [Patescibacteria group bacterium]